MMNERHSDGRANGEKQLTLDERLTAYYGAELREQPLSTYSWLHLRSQLGSQRTASHRRFARRLRLPHFRRRGSAPAFVSAAFARITYEARVSYSPSKIGCTIKPRARMPQVHISLLGRRNIRLTLPSAIEHSITPVELDVLLATGLARYLHMRKLSYMLPRLFCYGIVPLACLMLALLWQQGSPFKAVLIAITLCVLLCGVIWWLLHKQRRGMVFQADAHMVQWLGRERACQGLRALADRGQQSRARTLRRWGEVSLVERINRVCGTHVSVEHERLTLVR
jgi:hypothetical protein